MQLNKDVYIQAKKRLEQKRLKAVDDAEKRKTEIYSLNPRFFEIETELKDIGVKTAKTVLNGGNVKENLNSLKEKSDNLKKEYNSLLEKYSVSEAYLKPKYFCSKCNDTGYVETDNKTLICDCLKDLITEENCRKLSEISPLKLSTFDSFTMDYYDNKVVDRVNVLDRMSKIYNYCLNYADNFNLHSTNILMQGGTGLGKTHLSLAIANELIRKGFGVVYVTAPDILSKLQREHFNYNYKDEDDTFSTLKNCDLLIIDDLGTEFISSFSLSTIYNIINTRIICEKPIIINTNLSLSEIEQTYSQRTVSRIIGNFDRLDFVGYDFRAK